MVGYLMVLENLGQVLALFLEIFQSVLVRFESLDELVVVAKLVDELSYAFNDLLELSEESAVDVILCNLCIVGDCQLLSGSSIKLNHLSELDLI